MIEAFSHPTLTADRAPARAGVRIGDPIGELAVPMPSRLAEDARFFVGAYLGAFVFFLAWLG